MGKGRKIFIMPSLGQYGPAKPKREPTFLDRVKIERFPLKDGDVLVVSPPRETLTDPWTNYGEMDKIRAQADELRKTLREAGRRVVVVVLHGPGTDWPVILRCIPRDELERAGWVHKDDINGRLAALDE